jgi:glycosyl transferase family 25
MTIATYVINLDGSAQRLDAIGREFAALGIEFERVSAFDGRHLNLATVSDYEDARAIRYMGRSLVGGEIGCYRSHLDVASRFLESDADYALVLEDDAVPLCDPLALLAQALPDLEAIDPDWILINIGNNKLKIATFLSRYTVGGRNCVLAAAHYFPMTTSAIVWSRTGARRFVDGHDTIFAPVDNYFRYWLTREGHGYSFWPAPMKTTAAESQITTSGGANRKKNGRKWYYGIAKQKRLIEEKLIAFRKRRQLRRRVSDRT